MFNWIRGLFADKTATVKVTTITPVLKEHWDHHYEPNVVSYTKFRARRLLQEKDKREAETEENRKQDQEADHNPWLDK